MARQKAAAKKGSKKASSSKDTEKVSKKKVSFSKQMSASLAKSRLKAIGKYDRDVDEESRVRGWLPSGCRALDLVMGGRGYAWERISTIHGPPQGGKSALGIAACVEAQKIEINGDRGIAQYIEYEGGFDPKLARARGLVFEPGLDALEDRLSTVEDMFDYIELVCNAVRESDNPERFVCFVVDSVTAMPTDEELNHEDKWRARTMGSQARVNSKNLKLLRSVIRGLNVVVILISQDREKIVTGVGSTGGKPTGGNAPGYYASHVLTVKASENLYTNSSDKKVSKYSIKHKPIGIKMNVVVRKSRSGAPMRVVDIPFYFDRGIDQYEAEFWALREFDRLARHSKTGDRYTLKVNGKEHEFVGVKGFKQLLTDPEIDDAVWQMLQEEWGIKVNDKLPMRPKDSGKRMGRSSKEVLLEKLDEAKENLKEALETVREKRKARGEPDDDDEDELEDPEDERDDGDEEEPPVKKPMLKKEEDDEDQD